MRSIKRFIPLLWLSLYLSYQAGITMFAHVHYVNGVMIVHSHPSKSPGHTHTEGQYLLLYQLSHVQALEAFLPQCPDKPEMPFVLLKEETDPASKQAVLSLHRYLRAPPFCKV